MIHLWYRAEEFACPCCGANKIKEDLIDLLDLMAHAFGFKVFFNSAYRCEKHNIEEKGKPESAHVTGEAIDVDVLRRPNSLTEAQYRFMIEDFIFRNGVNRKGTGKTFIHFDISKTLPQNRSWVY